MKTIILAAGQSSRFYPFSEDYHKTMISILGKPILEHTILALKGKNLTDIIIVISPSSRIKEYFGDGQRFGVSITYVVQEKPLGQADALLLCKEQVDGDFLLLGGGHRVDIGDYIDKVLETKKGKDGVFVVTERKNPWEYGVIAYDGETVTGIVEKPLKGSEPSNLCLVSIYVLSKSFFPILESLTREHYLLEKALDQLTKQVTIGLTVIKEQLVTLKYPWDLLVLKNYLLDKTEGRISKKAKISPVAIISGKVIIEDGAQILEHACIKGPCYIGKNVIIGNSSLIRDYSSIEENVVVGAFSEVKNSLLGQGTKTHAATIGDCIVGKDCRIGARFVSGHVRLDRGPITTVVKGEKVSTNLHNLGVLMGDKVSTGVGVATMPGIIVGEGSFIGPGTIVFENVEKHTRYYVKPETIIKEKIG